MRIWYTKNRVRKSAYVREWERLNPEKTKSYRRKIRDRSKYKDSIDRARKRWIDRNPEEWRMIRKVNGIRRRTRTYKLDPINLKEWKVKVATLGNVCQICRKTEPEVKMTIDHIIPVARGGTNRTDNLQPLCVGCNCSKGAKLTTTQASH